MKHKSGTLRKRKIGEARKTQSIYDNLGHPYDLEGKGVIFIGKEEKAYSLTKGKSYTVIKSHEGKFCWDKDFYERFKDKNDRNYESNQGENYFIEIINDKGHKRKYSHLMFKMGEK